MRIVGTKDQNYLSNQRERKNHTEGQAEHHTLVLVLVFQYLANILLKFYSVVFSSLKIADVLFCMKLLVA